jgi:hypothetical protein
VEIHPGVFVSSTDAHDWRPDPEVGGEMHVLVEEETAYVGMSRFRDVANPEPWTRNVKPYLSWRVSLASISSTVQPSR